MMESPKKILCEVYKSSKVEGLYVYIKRGAELEQLPEELTARLGNPSRVLQLMLTPEKKLARADVVKVMEEIESQGFYLQLPPSEFEKREM